MRRPPKLVWLSVFIIAIMRRAVFLVGLSIAYAAQSFSDWWQSLQLYPSDAEINPIVSMNWLTVRPFNTCTFLKTSSAITRSEEHTSELQSRGLISYAVFC